ncbi:hypothetical protein KY289_000338 [Solanum tuberosum]|nr:hypothetical protein KY289_000338 [Solanum tuberosum]
MYAPRLLHLRASSRKQQQRYQTASTRRLIFSSSSLFCFASEVVQQGHSARSVCNSRVIRPCSPRDKATWFGHSNLPFEFGVPSDFLWCEVVACPCSSRPRSLLATSMSLSCLLCFNVSEMDEASVSFSSGFTV